MNATSSRAVPRRFARVSGLKLGGRRRRAPYGCGWRDKNKMNKAGGLDSRKFGLRSTPWRVASQAVAQEAAYRSSPRSHSNLQPVKRPILEKVAVGAVATRFQPVMSDRRWAFSIATLRRTDSSVESVYNGGRRFFCSVMIASCEEISACRVGRPLTSANTRSSPPAQAVALGLEAATFWVRDLPSYATQIWP